MSVRLLRRTCHCIVRDGGWGGYGGMRLDRLENRDEEKKEMEKGREGRIKTRGCLDDVASSSGRSLRLRFVLLEKGQEHSSLAKRNRRREGDG